jgi:predicted ATP-grasp superfamily ATP-dependent carboligase
VPTTGRWLRKPRGGSGGFGIRTADPGESPTPTHDIQEFIEGRSLSALFVSHGKATTLLGVTEQLIGERWLHTTDFRYCGNLGPVEASDELQSSLCQLACSIAAETGLRGVWGMDFILRDEQPFLVEVNPRYTSGIEVLELATLVPILTAHAACYTTMSGPTVDRRPTTRGIVGKAIYFAPHRIVFPQDGPWCGDVEGPFDSCRLPRFADIPVAGEPIETGSPVLTFFATSSTVEQCRAILKETAADLDRLFAEEHSP